MPNWLWCVSKQSIWHYLCLQNEPTSAGGDELTSEKACRWGAFLSCCFSLSLSYIYIISLSLSHCWAIHQFLLFKDVHTSLRRNDWSLGIIFFFFVQKMSCPAWLTRHTERFRFLHLAWKSREKEASPTREWCGVYIIKGGQVEKKNWPPYLASHSLTKNLTKVAKELQSALLCYFKMQKKKS